MSLFRNTLSESRRWFLCGFIVLMISCSGNIGHDSGDRDGEEGRLAASGNVENGITIYFQKPHTWNAAWIWYNKDNDGTWETQTLAAAPGDMEEYRPGWFRKVIRDTGVVAFLFNDGSWSNTMKWRGPQGIDFLVRQDVWVTAEGDKYFADPMKDITVYFKQPAGWSSPNVYAWLGDGSTAKKLAGNWPGTAMAAAPEQGSRWFKYTLNGQVNCRLIFNDGIRKTDDLERIKSGFYKDAAWHNRNPETASPVTVRKLGADYQQSYTTFAIWSPDTHEVSVTVNGVRYPCAPINDFDGYTDVYAARVEGNLHLAEYQFAINGIPVRDPYGVMVKHEPGVTLRYKEREYDVSADVGSATNIVVDLSRTNPLNGWRDVPAASDTYKERVDAIVYEASVRDFTMHENSGVDEAKRGKYLGMVQAGTRCNDKTTGLDHLKELGITHVQLMPLYDFATKTNHSGGDTQYNWGYDPVNYNVPEDRYSMNPSDYVGRIRELKTMVSDLHGNGIRVVADVVYNHTFMPEMFDAITQKYYDGLDRSGCSNSINVANPMVSRFIRDSLEYWVKEYNVDGFRFDLIGIYNYQEVKKWGEYLNNKYPGKKILIYGEPWGSGSDLTNMVSLGSLSYLKDAHVGAFNNQFRYAIKGDSDKVSEGCQGYMFNRVYDNRGGWDIEVGMRGSLTTSTEEKIRDLWEKQFAVNPEQTINYITAHDNLNLYDRIAAVNIGNDGYEREIGKFGNGIVLTAQGIPFIHYGEEFRRTKAIGAYAAHKDNSYMWGDEMNRIDWSLKTYKKNPTDENEPSNYETVFRYYRDLIAIRKAHPGLRMRTREEIQSRIHSYRDDARGVVVAEIDEDNNTGNGPELIVVYNCKSPYRVGLPSGNWRLLFDKRGRATDDKLIYGVDRNVCDGTGVTILEKY